VDTVQLIAKDGNIRHVRSIRNCKINNKAGEPDFEFSDNFLFHMRAVELERDRRNRILLQRTIRILAKDPAKQKAIVDSNDAALLQKPLIQQRRTRCGKT
jgi:hypothetical protein